MTINVEKLYLTPKGSLFDELNCLTLGRVKSTSHSWVERVEGDSFLKPPPPKGLPLGTKIVFEVTLGE